MFPTLRQRLLIAVGLVIAAGAGELLAQAAFGAVDGRGATILGSHNPGMALVMLVVYTIAIGAMAVWLGSAGNPLTGVFIVAAGLLWAAGRGGAIDGWIRAIDSPGAYLGLAGEAAVLAVPIVAVRLALHGARRRLRGMTPGLLLSAYCEEVHEEHEAEPPMQAAAALAPILIAVGVIFGLQNALFGDYLLTVIGAMIILLGTWAATIGVETWMDKRAGRPIMRTPTAPAFLGGAVVLSVGGAAMVLLARDADPGQVIGAMLLSFTATGLLAHQMYPTRARLTLVLAPLMLAVAAYIVAGTGASSVQELLARYYADYARAAPPIVPLNPLAKALPIYYASAGVIGVSLGIGWSQTIHASRQKHVTLTA